MSLVAALALALTLLVVSVSDIRERVISNRVLLAAAAIWLIVSVLSGAGWLGVAGGLAAGVLICLPLLAAALLKPEGMGMGDVKLVAVIGLFLGWQAWTALLIGLALAGMTGILIALGRRQSPSATCLPLAPFLAVGTLPVMLLAVLPLQ